MGPRVWGIAASLVLAGCNAPEPASEAATRRFAAVDAARLTAAETEPGQ